MKLNPNATAMLGDLKTKSDLFRLFGAKFSKPAEAVKFRQRAEVFISRDNETAIVVTLHYNGQGGFLFEDVHPIVLQGPLAALVLGHETQAALRRTQIHPPVSFANHKPKDWPAFQASRIKAIRQFEQDFIRIQIDGANEANLVYRIEGYPTKGAELKVLASLSSGVAPEKLGERIILVYRACRDRRV